MTKLPELDQTASRKQLLTGLRLAIAEAKMVHYLIRRKPAPRNLEEVRTLVNVEREIDYLETTLGEIESEASAGVS